MALLAAASLFHAAFAPVYETVAYLGDPQIGFSGDAIKDAERFGLAADASAGAAAVVVAGDLVNSWMLLGGPAGAQPPSCTER